MRFLKIISGLLICHSFFVNAQKEIDSIQLNKLQEDKLYKIEQWEKQIENAREKEDVYTEMVALMQKIYFQINDYGDQVTTYKDLRYLEGLVEKNPKNRAVKNIIAPIPAAVPTIVPNTNHLPITGKFAFLNILFT